MVEATLAIPLLLMILFIIFQMVLLGYRVVVTEYALQRAARFATTGTPLAGKTRVESIVEVFNDHAGLFGVQIPASDMSMCPLGRKCTSEKLAGSAGDLIKITIFHRMPSFLASSFMNLRSEIVVRNESFC